MAWIWTFISVIIFVYLLRHKKKKRVAPGPLGLPIIGHLHLLGKNPHRDLHNLARKHGPIMCLRFGIVPAIIISSPSGAELVLKTHDLVFASRPHNGAMRYLGYGQRDLVWGTYGTYWRNMRKLCTLELLSIRKMNQFESMRKAEVGLLVSSLKQAAETGESVDLTARVFALSGDMNCLMILGRKYCDSELVERGFESLFREMMEVVGNFNLADYLPCTEVLDLQGMNKRIKQLTRVFDVFLEKIIDDHVENKQEKKQNEDFVDTLMAIMESREAGFEFDRRHIKAVLLNLLVAGMDTSATAIDWAVTELVRHPSAMKKLQKELESVVGLNYMVEESHLNKLKYLDFVVKETLRLHPVAPLLLPHESMEVCELEGFHIPKKSRVMVNVWAMGRDPNVWEEPESFSPDRFIDSNIDLQGRDFKLIPFGAGRRGCPGMQLGLVAFKLVLAQLVHCFNWELPNGMLSTQLDMSEHFGVVTARAEHLIIIPNYRLRLHI